MNTPAESERLLKTGVTAYKSGEYERAIASLQPLLRNRTYRLKAGMGLVRVYMSQRNWREAEKLCKKIGQSSQPSVQQWSKATLTKIEQRRAKADAVSSEDNKASRLTIGLSGFTPLASTSEIFIPPASNATKPTNATSASSTSSVASRKPVLPEREVLEPKTAASSIFHYAHLNDELEADAPAPTNTNLKGSAEIGWRYAGRLAKGRSLGKIRTGKLWVPQMVGAVGFCFLARYLLNGAISILNSYLAFLSGLPLLGWIRPFPLSDATGYLLAALGVMAIASPWLWDFWLRLICDRQSFSLNELRPRSAEAATIIAQRCRQRRWPLQPSGVAVH